MTRPRLGSLLSQQGLVTEDQIKEALRLQVGGNRRLGYLLIKMGLITDDQLIDALSHQLELPITSIDQEFSKDVAQKVPRYLCRKHSAIPLSLDSNNVLNLAMTDPLDDESISDIENYTGMAVRPVLAKQKDISDAIPKHIPFSGADIANFQIYGGWHNFFITIAIIFVIAVGLFVKHNISLEKYGTVSIVGTETVFKNHDLMVGVNSSENKISLLGHGAYAKGYYSVSFNNVEMLKNFVEHKKKNFSDKQYKWLIWVTDEKMKTKS